jgi:diadenosine tetraphosphate (Ap4A) HIT family hydrolase
LGAEGTNIMINEGVPAGQRHAHAMIHIIPRKKDDGLNFEWPQKQIPEDYMAKIHDLLKVPQEMKVEKEPEQTKRTGSL